MKLMLSLFLILLGSHVSANYESFRNSLQSVPRYVNLSVSLDLERVLSVDESRGTATLGFYIAFQWEDMRVATRLGSRHGRPKKECTGTPGNSIWFPDVEFGINAVEGTCNVGQSGGNGVLLCNDGSLKTGKGCSQTVSATFDVRDFPFDTHQVDVTLIHPFLTSQFLFIHLHNCQLVQNKGQEEFLVWEIRSFSCAEAKERAAEGYFSIISGRVRLARNPGYYLKNLASPGTLVTVASIMGTWATRGVGKGPLVSFIPCLTTLMSLFVLTLSVNKQLPKTGQVCTLDIFMTSLVAPVFLAPVLSIFCGYCNSCIGRSGRQAMRRLEALFFAILIFIPLCSYAWFWIRARNHYNV